MITRFLLLSAVTILLWAGGFRAEAQDGCSQLIWADEFNVEGAPDPTRWNFETGGGGWGNNELQFYTDSRNNSYVSNGTLKIHARKSNNAWTSARMVTAGKASWQYGRFEIRAKLPTGRGTWPALWMMPQNSIYGGWPQSGEIDIMEHVGYDPGKIHGTVHTEAYNHKLGTQKGSNVMVSNFNTEFHLYAIEWTESQITWYVDGKSYFTFLNEKKTYKEWPFDHPFFLIFNIAIGGDWGGAQGIDPALTEAVMEIDYVRVYSNSLPRPVVQGPAFVVPGKQVTFSVTQPIQATYHWTFPEGVSLVSGAGTAAVTVIWGDQPGEVVAEVRNSCDSVASAPFMVNLQTQPEGEYLVIPFRGNNQELLWSAVPGDQNQISLREENGELVVTYNIQNPNANPRLAFQFAAATDLTRHREMSLQLAAAAGAAPSNMRIDLLDAAGRNDLNDLFKIDNYTGTGQYTTHTKTFAMNSSAGWEPSKVSQVRVYFNYGILGQRGAGEFRLKNMKMRDPLYVKTLLAPAGGNLTIWPNPVRDWVSIRSGEPISTLTVMTMQGQVVSVTHFPAVLTTRANLSALPPGSYILSLSGNKGVTGRSLIVKR
ncbi:MAG: family 16 glycosylhydrolase [Bacteroidales bacterium]|nr:family 16 glycosylhydrolase [Bacteroidales bacterium]